MRQHGFSAQICTTKKDDKEENKRKIEEINTDPIQNDEKKGKYYSFSLHALIYHAKCNITHSYITRWTVFLNTRLQLWCFGYIFFLYWLTSCHLYFLHSFIIHVLEKYLVQQPAICLLLLSSMLSKTPFWEPSEYFNNSIH